MYMYIHTFIVIVYRTEITLHSLSASCFFPLMIPCGKSTNLTSIPLPVMGAPLRYLYKNTF